MLHSSSCASNGRHGLSSLHAVLLGCIQRQLNMVHSTQGAVSTNIRQHLCSSPRTLWGMLNSAQAGSPLHPTPLCINNRQLASGPAHTCTKSPSTSSPPTSSTPEHTYPVTMLQLSKRGYIRTVCFLIPSTSEGCVRWKTPSHPPQSRWCSC